MKMEPIWETIDEEMDLYSRQTNINSGVCPKQYGLTTNRMLGHDNQVQLDISSFRAQTHAMKQMKLMNWDFIDRTSRRALVTCVLENSQSDCIKNFRQQSHQNSVISKLEKCELYSYSKKVLLPGRAKRETNAQHQIWKLQWATKVTLSILQ